MRPGPTSALKLMSNYLSIDHAPIRARDLLIRICIGEGWEQSDTVASEKAEKWETAFLRQANEELVKLNDLGRYSPFVFNSSANNMIQGVSFVEPRDSSKEIEAKVKRGQHNFYADQIANINPRRFEALCAGILSLIGVASPHLTRYSGDEGIDFFGMLSLGQQIAPNPVFSNFLRQMNIWLVGQAKHYRDSKVATPELRELVGSIELARSRTYASLNSSMDNLILRICDPVYYLFFTTGSISADGWRLIKRSGIIGMDGEMIAAFLADNGVGVKDGAFDEVAFLAWLEPFES